MSPSQTRSAFQNTININGWLSPEAGRLMSALNRIQQDEGVQGHIFEIGVHHGKSAMLLGAMLRPNERLHVCDIFGQMEANVSASGSGDKQTFLGNYDKYVGNRDRLVIYEMLSSSLPVSEIKDRFRLFHVDGGHNADEALFDLHAAAQTLSPGGAIIVDDPFREAWPGVTEAIVRFLQEKPDYASVVVGYNKHVIVERAWLERYQQRFDNDRFRIEYVLDMPPNRYKKLPFMNDPLGIFFQPGYLLLPRLKTKLSLMLMRMKYGQ